MARSSVPHDAWIMAQAGSRDQGHNAGEHPALEAQFAVETLRGEMASTATTAGLLTSATAQMFRDHL
jgi:hypothetical protein